MKVDRTCQAGCWEARSLPALLHIYQPSWKELVKIAFLSVASEVHVVWAFCLVGFGGVRGTWFLNMDSWIFNRELHQLCSASFYSAT